jgi:hypothetical protein
MHVICFLCQMLVKFFPVLISFDFFFLCHIFTGSWIYLIMLSVGLSTLQWFHV